MTPGYKTTEFWLTLLTQIGSLVAIVHPGFHIGDQTMTTAAGLIALAISSIHFTRSRTQLKENLNGQTVEQTAQEAPKV